MYYQQHLPPGYTAAASPPSPPGQHHHPYHHHPGSVPLVQQQQPQPHHQQLCFVPTSPPPPPVAGLPMHQFYSFAQPTAAVVGPTTQHYTTAAPPLQGSYYQPMPSSAQGQTYAFTSVEQATGGTFHQPSYVMLPPGGMMTMQQQQHGTSLQQPTYVLVAMAPPQHASPDLPPMASLFDIHPAGGGGGGAGAALGGPLGQGMSISTMSTSTGSTLSAAERAVPCKHFASGTCNRRKCRFMHQIGSTSSPATPPSRTTTTGVLVGAAAEMAGSTADRSTVTPPIRLHEGGSGATAVGGTTSDEGKSA